MDKEKPCQKNTACNTIVTKHYSLIVKILRHYLSKKKKKDPETLFSKASFPKSSSNYGLWYLIEFHDMHSLILNIHSFLHLSMLY